MAGRQNEYADQIIAGLFLELLGTLPVNVEEHITTRFESLINRRRRRAVRVVKNHRVLEKGIGPAQRFKAIGTDKVIVTPIDFGRSSWPGGRRDAHHQIAVACDQASRQGCLARPGRRGQHQHQTAATDFFSHALFPVTNGRRYSTFCACSLN